MVVPLNNEIRFDMGANGNIFRSNSGLADESSIFVYHTYWASNSQLWGTLGEPLKNDKVFHLLYFVVK